MLLALLAILALPTPLVLFVPVLRACGVTNGNGEAGRGKRDTNGRVRLGFRACYGLMDLFKGTAPFT